jgi:hypothetical protein
MEYLSDGLVVLVKQMHLGFLLGLCLKIKEKEDGKESFLGDNLPHVFLKRTLKATHAYVIL